ncbi:MAG: sterol desaturase family protein [Gammaproteobacteria bacterium]|nr:sterol desaturase family protein [Gammaproteobacteria bacterium]
MAGLEAWRPRRPASGARLPRWAHNLGLALGGTLLVRVMLPVGAVGVALLAQAYGLGLFNTLAGAPALAFVASLLLLDLAIYFQHRLFHAVPWLWRLHRVHHADPAFDVSTALRFHPIEIGLSMAIKAAVVIALGAPPLAVLVFEVGLNACALFNHANLRLPTGLDRPLRRLLVTPDMHRVHHSVVPAETHSNFGFNLSWWDRLFGTYRAQPAAGHTAMTIGNPDYHEPRQVGRLWGMLAMPFVPPRRA